MLVVDGLAFAVVGSDASLGITVVLVVASGCIVVKRPVVGIVVKRAVVGVVCKLVVCVVPVEDVFLAVDASVVCVLGPVIVTWRETNQQRESQQIVQCRKFWARRSTRHCGIRLTCAPITIRV